jgi:drug/metabolite transporter (DMT)-like permease
VYVALAAIAWSSAGLLQRELHVGVATQVAGRAFFALLALLVYVAARQRGRVVHSFRAIGRAGVAIAVLMAISSGAFIVALNHTSVANVLFTQALAPILAALLARTLGEPTPRRTWLTMAIALAGVTVMVGGPGRPNALGLGLSFLVSASFAGILVITRHRRDVSMAPATCLSQAIVLLVAGPLASPGSVGARDVVFFVLIGVGQIGLGFVFLTVGARLIPAAEVALITLLEVVLGPLWVWIALSEQPGTATLVGGAIVLIAVALQARPQPAPAPI